MTHGELNFKNIFELTNLACKKLGFLLIMYQFLDDNNNNKLPTYSCTHYYSVEGIGLYPFLLQDPE